MDFKDYDGLNKFFERSSCGAIIRKADEYALTYSITYDYYVFPGGGIEPGESEKECVIREVSEEVGLDVDPSSIQEFGMIERFQKMNPDIIFHQKHMYYTCQVYGDVHEQHLTDAEKEKGLVLEWARLEKAIDVNQKQYEMTGMGMV